MNIYSSFGLGAAPFESRPDPRYFFRALGHTESVATLDFAVRTSKTCTLIVGESGTGKTLVGLVAAERANLNSRVVWVHGLAPPEGDALLTVFPRGTLAPQAMVETARPAWGTLRSWAQRGPTTNVPTVIVVDHADSLPLGNWNDLLALITRDVRGSRPAVLILLGSPQLLNRMATRRLARLRRRLFRTCALRAFEADDTAAYVRHRLEVAGGSDMPFTPAAIEVIQRYSRGIPACINQICDSALVDAFGDDRTTVDADHVPGAVRGIRGPKRPPRALPSTALRQLGSTPAPMLTAGSIGLTPERHVVLERLELLCAAGAPHQSVTNVYDSAARDTRVVSAFVSAPASLDAAECAPSSAVALAGEPAPADSLANEPNATAAPVVVTSAPPSPSANPSVELCNRIQHIESRVTAVLSRVRAVRSRIGRRDD